MASLGLQAYRFSVAWPRIQPTGSGRASPKGLDFYGRLVDRLTHSEPWVFTVLGHWLGLQAPGEKDLGGWFAWSLLDNFERSMGYRPRFGLVYVDFASKRRVPKDCARFYAEVIRQNGWTAEARRAVPGLRARHRVESVCGGDRRRAGGDTMRVMLRMEIDQEKGSQALKDGTLQRTLAEFMEKVKPETQYFGPNEHGVRTAWMVFDFTDASKMPPLFEPLFDRLGAHITLLPVMTLQELQRGFQQLG